MNTQECVKELGFNNGNEITKAELKKRYRSLMRKNHPDLAHDEQDRLKKEARAKRINEAYEKLERLIQRRDFEKLFEEKREISAIIPLDGLVELYDGNSIKLRDNNGDFELTKSNIRAHRIVLECCCSILDKSTGFVSVYSKYEQYHQGDEYSIDCTLQVKDTSPIDIEVSAYGKVVKLTLNNLVTRLKLTYRYRVQFTINIQKVVMTGAE